jgi:hypothetical protein
MSAPQSTWWAAGHTGDGMWPGLVRSGSVRRSGWAVCGSGRGQAHPLQTLDTGQRSSERKNIFAGNTSSGASGAHLPCFLNATACVPNDWNPRFNLSPLLDPDNVPLLFL